MALWPGPDRSCFYLDPTAGLTDSNYWRDSSPYGLHVTPVGYSAPNYGLVIGTSGAPRIVFDGASNTGTIPGRFYNTAPSSVITLVIVAKYDIPTAGDVVFWCRDGAATKGFYVQNATSERQVLLGLRGGVSAYVRDSAGAIVLTQRTRVSIYSMDVRTTAIRSIWHDGSQVTPDVLTTIASIDYDVTAIPTIGGAPGSPTFDGDLYHLAIYPIIFTDQEARACSAYWMDRT